MSGIPTPLKGPVLFSPRTANYVSSFIREGDKFDYYRWPRQVRGEAAQAKGLPQAITPRKIASAEIEPPVSTPDCQKASRRWTLFTRRQPIPGGLRRSHREPLASTSNTRIRQRLEKVRDAWDNFQASRVRDAVYGYLEAVGASIAVRRSVQRARYTGQGVYEGSRRSQCVC
jgi:hypothetical protein